MSEERRRPSIATRTGDLGETSLLFGRRVQKTHPQIVCCGNFDELNSAIGFAKTTATDAWVREQLMLSQRDLVALMGEISTAEEDVARYEESSFPKLNEEAIARVDAAVEAIEARQPTFHGWATPGANLHAAALDLARTVCRRAERTLLSLPDHGRHPRPLLVRYTNRLSDLLWLMARLAETPAQ